MAVPAALTRGYSNSFMDTMLSRATFSRAEPPVLTSSQLDALDQVQA